MRPTEDFLIEDTSDVESPPPSSATLKLGKSRSLRDDAGACDCFKRKRNLPYGPEASVLACASFPCDVCIDGLLCDLDLVMSKLPSLKSSVDEESFSLILAIASPALRLLSAHLGESIDHDSPETPGRNAPNICGNVSTGSRKTPTSPTSTKFTRPLSSQLSKRSNRNDEVARRPTPRLERNESCAGTFLPSHSVTKDFSSPDIGRRHCGDGEGASHSFFSPHKLSFLGHLYIDPNGNFRMAWDTTAFITILLMVIFVPFELTFLWDTDTNWNDSYPSLWWFSVFVDWFFAFDIVLTCFTPFYSDRGRADLVKNHSRIVRRYLKGWFWVDVISTFPFSRVADAFGASSNGVSVLRAIRFTKIARVLKVVQGMKLGGLVHLFEARLIATRSATLAFHLFKLCLCMLISCHWAACFWFIIGYASGKCGYSTTWVLDFSDGPMIELYSASFYFCITTGSTVGYGDIHATNTMEMLAGSFLLTCSVLGIGQMIAQVGEVVVTFQDKKAEAMRLRRDAKEFMRTRGVPRDLYLQVLRFLDGVGKNDSLISFEGAGFVEHLSESLQSELRFAIVGHIIKCFPVFSEIHDGFVKALCQVVEAERVGVGDIIVDVEQSCEAMFMIVSGELSYHHRGGTGGILSRLDWFGERALFFELVVYNMTVTCEVESELMILRRRRLMEQLQLFPKVQAEYQSILETLKAKLKPKVRLSLRRSTKSQLSLDVAFKSSVGDSVLLDEVTPFEL